MSFSDRLLAREDLTPSEVEDFSAFLLADEVRDEEKAVLLKALTEKGETADELAAFVMSFLEKARRPDFSAALGGAPSIDVCGTGGDKLDLFNVSTTSMFIIAAGGAKVIKHGNRGVTSQSGSSDVLAELGIPLDATDDQLAEGVESAGMCFLFAPLFHPAFKAVVGVRALLAKQGVRSIFNLIGPLLNPASPSHQLVGVSFPERTRDYAQILKKLGRKQVYAVTGYTEEAAPLDEFSTLGKNDYYLTGEGKTIEKKTIFPEDLGLKRAALESLKGGGAKENAQTLQALLSGEEKGAKRDIILLNAGAGLACGEIASDLKEGVEMARELLESGKALKHLRMLQEVCAGWRK